MTERVDKSLCDPVLVSLGLHHGFGQFGSRAPEGTFFPEQVHGIAVLEVGVEAEVKATLGLEKPPADIVLSRKPGTSVGIVTADCVPILVAALDGSVVGAIHAGWRGLAAGVVEVGLQAIRGERSSLFLAAAVGPAVRKCCYEIDEEVRHALSSRYSGDLDDFLVAGRPEHFQLDLAGLAARILSKNGVENHRIGMQNCICTICSGSRFESFRRDGSAAGRLRHFICNSMSPGEEG